MKPTQNTIIHVMLGLTALLSIVLFYALLAPHGYFAWAVFVTLVLATFVPILLRRRRGLPPPMSPIDSRVYALVTLTGVVLAVIGGTSGMTWIMVLGILFGPLYFMVRGVQLR